MFGEKYTIIMPRPPAERILFAHISLRNSSVGFEEANDGCFQIQPIAIEIQNLLAMGVFLYPDA